MAASRGPGEWKMNKVQANGCNRLSFSCSEPGISWVLTGLPTHALQGL